MSLQNLSLFQHKNVDFKNSINGDSNIYKPHVALEIEGAQIGLIHQLKQLEIWIAILEAFQRLGRQRFAAILMSTYQTHHLRLEHKFTKQFAIQTIGVDLNRIEVRQLCVACLGEKYLNTLAKLFSSFNNSIKFVYSDWYDKYDTSAKRVWTWSKVKVVEWPRLGAFNTK